MRVLFVDDDRHAFRGVDVLLPSSSPCQFQYVADSGSALRAMEKARFDLIVTDTRLAGNDATSLLRAVKDQFPRTMRLVLSDHEAFAPLRQGVSLEHQFQSRPAVAEVLVAHLMRAGVTQARINSDSLQTAVGKVGRLPAVPRIYSELTKAMSRPNADTMEIGRIVSQDPAMSVKVLQLVNSAFFSRGATCTDVSQAVMRLGLSMLRNLVLSVEVFQPGGGDGKGSVIDIDAEHRHALRCAALGRKLLDDRRKADDVFTAGIIHDIGRLLLARKLPEAIRDAQAHASGSELPPIEAERSALGFTHADFGAYVLGMWGVPYNIVEAVAFHHDPTAMPGRTGFGITEALFVANHLAHGEEIPSEALGDLGIQDRIVEWTALAEDFAEAA